MIMRKKVTPSVILLFLLLLVFTALIGCGSSGDAPVVADVSVTGVTLNKTSTLIPVGSTEQLTATIAPANATNQNVTWSTSDADKATVSLSGLVTTVAAGTATITVTTVDGGFTATCTVTVPKWYVDPLGTNDGSHGTTTGAGAFKTIQYAITAAAAADIIKVAAGEYTEQLLIQKDLILTGAGIGQTIVKAPTSGRATYPGHTTWYNLSGGYEGDSGWNSEYILAAYPTDWNGMTLTGTPISVKVTGFTFDANDQYNHSAAPDRFTGVFFGSVKGTAIGDAGLFNSVVQGFPGDYHSTTGVRVFGDSNLTIDHNTIGYTITGVAVYGDAGSAPDPKVAITYNTINLLVASASGDEQAIDFSAGSTGLIDHNTIPNGVYGIALYADQNPAYSTVSYNTLSNLTGDAIDIVENAVGNSIDNNTITNSGTGIFIGDGSDNNTFTANTITDNAIGVQVDAYAGGTVPAGLVFNNNNISGNTVGFDNTETTVVNAQNNWWGAASGPSGVGLGTGDTVSDNVNFNPWLTVAP